MEYSKEMLETYTKIVKQTFRKLQKLAKERKIKLSLKILHDPSVSKAILNYVNSSKFDLLVVGSHGRTGINRIILGSVANDIVHKSNCPVMVVK